MYSILGNSLMFIKRVICYFAYQSDLSDVYVLYRAQIVRCDVLKNL